MRIFSQKIPVKIFTEVLNDSNLTEPDDLLIFRTIYGLSNHEASATDLARIIGWKDKIVVIGKIVRLGKRISKKYKLIHTKSENGTNIYWDIFFDGYYKGPFFIYVLKPELKQALEQSGLAKNITFNSISRAYLFTWNPNKWSWTKPDDNENLPNSIQKLNATGTFKIAWSCFSHKSIRRGDRAFLGIVGVPTKGIMGSGVVISEPEYGEHWSGEDKGAWYVWIDVDTLLNPFSESILTIEYLDSPNLSKQVWTPQASGISINEYAVHELEEKWFRFLNKPNPKDNQFINTNYYQNTSLEGGLTEVLQSRYERNIYARTKCLEHYGYICNVCDFDFEKKYGSLGFGYIHVHHLNPIHNAKKKRVVDPVNDLRPVCPNCHAMLHRSSPPLSIENLKDLIG